MENRNECRRVTRYNEPQFEKVNIKYYEQNKKVKVNEKSWLQPISNTKPVTMFSYCNPAREDLYNQARDSPDEGVTEGGDTEEDGDSIDERFERLAREACLEANGEFGSYLGIDTEKFFSSSKSNIYESDGEISGQKKLATPDKINYQKEKSQRKLWTKCDYTSSERPGVVEMDTPTTFFSKSEEEISTQERIKTENKLTKNGSTKQLLLDESQKESWAEYDETSVERGVDVDGVQLRPVPGRRRPKANEEMRKSVTFDKSVTYEFPDPSDGTKVQKGLKTLKSSLSKRISRLYDGKKQDRRTKSDPFAPRRPRLDTDRVSINSNDSALSEISARLTKVKNSLEQVYNNVDPEPELLDFYFDRSEFRGTVGSYNSGDTSSLTSRTSCDSYAVRSKYSGNYEDHHCYKRTKKKEKKYAGNQRKSVSDLGFQDNPMQEQFNLRRLKSMNFRSQILPLKESDGISTNQKPQPEETVESCETTDTDSNTLKRNLNLQVKPEKQRRRVSRSSSGNVLSKIQKYENIENKKYKPRSYEPWTSGMKIPGKDVETENCDLKSGCTQIKRSVSCVSEMDLSALRDDLRSERIEGYHDGQTVFNESNRREFLKPKLRLDSVNYLPVGSAGLRKNEPKANFVPVTHKYLEHLSNLNQGEESSTKSDPDGSPDRPQSGEGRTGIYQRLYSTSGEAFSKCKSTVQNIADSGIDAIKRNLLDSSDCADGSSPLKPTRISSHECDFQFLPSEDYKRYSLVDSDLDDLSYEPNGSPPVNPGAAEEATPCGKLSGETRNDTESDSSTITDNDDSSYINFNDQSLAYPKIVVTDDECFTPVFDTEEKVLRKFQTVSSLQHDDSFSWRFRRESNNTSNNQISSVRTPSVESNSELPIETEDEEHDFGSRNEDVYASNIAIMEKTAQKGGKMTASSTVEKYHHNHLDESIVMEESDSHGHCNEEQNHGPSRNSAECRNEEQSHGLSRNSAEYSDGELCEIRSTNSKKILSRGYSTSVLVESKESNTKICSETEHEVENQRMNMMASFRARSNSLDILISQPRSNRPGMVRSPSIVENFASLDSESRKKAASRLIETDQRLLNTFFDRLMTENSSKKLSLVREEESTTEDSPISRSKVEPQSLVSSSELKTISTGSLQREDSRNKLEFDEPGGTETAIRELEFKGTSPPSSYEDSSVIKDEYSHHSAEGIQSSVDTGTHENDSSVNTGILNSGRKYYLNEEKITFSADLESVHQQRKSTFPNPKKIEEKKNKVRSSQFPMEETDYEEYDTSINEVRPLDSTPKRIPVGEQFGVSKPEIQSRKSLNLETLEENGTKGRSVPPVTPRRFIPSHTRKITPPGIHNHDNYNTSMQSKESSNPEAIGTYREWFPNTPETKTTNKRNILSEKKHQESNTNAETGLKNCLIPKFTIQSSDSERPPMIEPDVHSGKSLDPPREEEVSNLESPADSEKKISTVIHESIPQYSSINRLPLRKRLFCSSQEIISSSDEEYGKMQFQRHDRRSLPKSLRVGYKNVYSRRASEQFVVDKNPELEILKSRSLDNFMDSGYSGDIDEELVSMDSNYAFSSE